MTKLEQVKQRRDQLVKTLTDQMEKFPYRKSINERLIQHLMNKTDEELIAAGNRKADFTGVEHLLPKKKREELDL